MERKLLYAFRGWIAFVAFMDLGTAFRSYIEKRSFLGDPSDSQYIAGKFTPLVHFKLLCTLKRKLNAFVLSNVFFFLYIFFISKNSQRTIFGFILLGRGKKTMSVKFCFDFSKRKKKHW